MWPTTTRNRGKSGTPGRGNEIWEGLRPLPFFSFAAPPHPRPYDGPCFCRISAPSVPPGRAAWPAPPSRPGAIAPRRVPCGGLMAVLGTKKGMRRRKLPGLPGPPPAGLWPPVAGGCRGLVVWGRARRGPSPVCPGQFSPPPEARGAQPPRPGSGQSWGAVIGWPGAPQRPGGRDGRGPLSGARAVVLFGLVPCRRRSGPRFSSRAGQRWKKAVRCPARGGSAAAAAGNGPGAKPPGKECGD